MEPLAFGDTLVSFPPTALVHFQWNQNPDLKKALKDHLASLEKTVLSLKAISPYTSHASPQVVAINAFLEDVRSASGALDRCFTCMPERVAMCFWSEYIVSHWDNISIGKMHRLHKDSLHAVNYHCSDLLKSIRSMIFQCAFTTTK